MKPANEKNPFESPAAVGEPETNEENVLRRAALGWQLPLIGLGMCPVLFFLVALMIPTSLSRLVSLGIATLVLGGLAMTIYSVLMLRSYPSVLHHVVGGLAIFLWILMAICGGLLIGWFLINAIEPPPPTQIPFGAPA